MADISKIALPNGNTYDLKDDTARTNLALKQDALVSGTTIKTINNVSLLGSGNITVGGSGTVVITEDTEFNIEGTTFTIELV